MAGDSQDRNKWVRWRMAAIVAVLLGGLAAVVGRVYYLQTARAAKLGQMSADQTTRSIQMKAKRGSILDRRGVEMAVTVEVPSIFVRPHKLDHPRRVARRLMPHLELGFQDLVDKLESDRGFVWLERQAKPSSAQAIRTLKIDGIGLATENKRYYPLGERAGQLLGFVGIDGNGLEGLESTFDDTLAGGSFELDGMRDAHGRTLLTRDLPKFRKFEGDSVVLTIDERIQRVAEAAIARQVEKFDAKAGYAIAMDVHTGEILALANTPSFDPNHFQDFDSSDWRLRNITDTFEPGSTFKPFVLAAALENDTVGLDTTFDTEHGRIRIGGYTIRDSHAHGTLTAAEIVQVSSNIGAYKIAQTVGRTHFYEALRDFGFGSRTGLGLRGEQPGLVWPPDRWAEVTFANMAFGQGLTVTPLQLAAGISAIANGGKLMEPRIVKETRNKNGDVIDHSRPRLVRRVLSTDSAHKTTYAMSMVTQEEGTGTTAALDHYTVAGKTGTAQKVNPDTRRYDPDLWLGSFVGFAPAESPDVAVLVMIDEPHGSHYGGVVAAPAFKKILRESLAARGVMPVADNERFKFDGDSPAEPAEADAPSAADADAEDIVTVAASKVADAPRVADADAVPDFRGMTLREATKRAKKMGQLPEIDGWGRVIDQTPEAGSPVVDGQELSLVLSPATRGALIARQPSGGSMQ